VRGELAVPSSPPAPDPDLLDRYAITDPARHAWWIDRLRRTLGLLSVL
jgi:O-succinylbenzoate synthase